MKADSCKVANGTGKEAEATNKESRTKWAKSSTATDSMGLPFLFHFSSHELIRLAN